MRCRAHGWGDGVQARDSEPTNEVYEYEHRLGGSSLGQARDGRAQEDIFQHGATYNMYDLVDVTIGNGASIRITTHTTRRSDSSGSKERVEEGLASRLGSLGLLLVLLSLDALLLDCSQHE